MQTLNFFFLLLITHSVEEKHQPQASLAFPTPGTLLLFPTDFPASQIVCVRLRRGDGRWRGGGGVEGKRTWSRLQPWTTACLCFWQREASRHKERFVAAVKTRDAQRLENMSDANERGDCGCGLGFQEKEVEDTSPLDRSVLMFYGLVSL